MNFQTQTIHTAALLLFFNLLVFSTVIYGFITAGDTFTFRDAYARQRVFHGVNVVYKPPPFIPITTHFSPQLSLSDYDMQNLTSWGFNVVRLGCMWEAVVPTPGKVNTTYLGLLSDLVNELGSYGIYTLLDPHQDAWGRLFCGEGAPEWISQACAKNALPFPLPLDFSVNVTNTSSCETHFFMDYCFSDAVGTCWEQLYDVNSTISAEFAFFWTSVATVFANNTFVLGYEILNEPWFGNVYNEPWMLGLNGLSDKRNLIPLYDHVREAIRNVDTNHILFYEPTITDEFPSGFSQGSLGNNAAYSYHVYCEPTTPGGNPKNDLWCDAFDTGAFLVKMDDLRRIQIPGIMTEFGAMVGDTAGADGVMSQLLDIADSFQQSWIYWQFKGFGDYTTASDSTAESFYDANGDLRMEKVKTLSRCFPVAVAGDILKFNGFESAFEMQFMPNLSCVAPTQVYCFGTEISVDPMGSLEWTLGDTGVIEFYFTNTTQSNSITVTISQ